MWGHMMFNDIHVFLRRRLENTDHLGEQTKCLGWAAAVFCCGLQSANLPKQQNLHKWIIFERENPWFSGELNSLDMSKWSLDSQVLDMFRRVCWRRWAEDAAWPCWTEGHRMSYVQQAQMEFLDKMSSSSMQKSSSYIGSELFPVPNALECWVPPQLFTLLFLQAALLTLLPPEVRNPRRWFASSGGLRGLVQDPPG